MQTALLILRAIELFCSSRNVDVILKRSEGSHEIHFAFRVRSDYGGISSIHGFADLCPEGHLLLLLAEYIAGLFNASLSASFADEDKMTFMLSLNFCDDMEELDFKSRDLLLGFDEECSCIASKIDRLLSDAQ